MIVYVTTTTRKKMDLLEDDEPQQQQQRPVVIVPNASAASPALPSPAPHQQLPQPRPHIVSSSALPQLRPQLVPQPLQQQLSAAAAPRPVVVVGQSNNNNNYPQQQQRPPQQQQQQTRPQSSNLDVLASLIRAQTKDAKPEDRNLLQHVLTCTLPPGTCNMPHCDDGKNKLEHFVSCKDQKCFHCVLARLFEALDKGAPRELWDRLNKSRSELQDGVRKVKRAVDDFNLIRAKATPEEARLATEALQQLKQNYNAAKTRYEDLCIEVYKVWVAPPGGKQYTADFVRRVVPRPTTAATAATSTPFVPTPAVSRPTPAPPQQQQPVAAPAAAVVQQQPRPVVPLPQPKRSEEIDGNLVEYLVLPPPDAAAGPTQQTNLLLAQLEKESDLLTQPIVSKQEEWDVLTKRLKRTNATEDKEPDWETHNVLSKQEIEASELRLFSKRLCVTAREHEYISRSGEELAVGELAQLAQIALHRHRTNPDQPLKISTDDVRALMRDPKSLFYQLAEEFERC